MQVQIYLFTCVKFKFVLKDEFRKGLTLKIVISEPTSKKKTHGASRETRSEEKRDMDGLHEEDRGAVGGFLLGPIKKPVSSSVSKSLLWHSRQLRKHLKAPEKPDNTSLVECRVPLGGRRDFAPCQRDTLRSPCVAISTLSYVLNIECPSRASLESSRDATCPSQRNSSRDFRDYLAKQISDNIFAERVSILNA